MTTTSFLTILPGVRVQTLNGEVDLDENSQERHTPAGSVGWIAAHNHRDASGLDNWNVHFPNGAAIILTSDELKDATQYAVSAPQSLRECALYAAAVQEERALGRFTHDLSPMTTLAGHAALILALLDGAAQFADCVESIEQRTLAAPSTGDDYTRLLSSAGPLLSIAKSLHNPPT